TRARVRAPLVCDEARLLPGPRRVPRRERGRRQESLPQARPQVPSRPQSRGPPRGRGALQGDLGGLPGALRPGAAEPLRPLRTRRLRAGRAGGRGLRLRRQLRGHHRRPVRGLLRHGPDARRARPHAARAGSPLRPRDQLRGGGLRVREDDRGAPPVGLRLKRRGEGEAGTNAGMSGDLYVMLSVREHPLFVREGTDVVCEVPLSFAQAALGTEIEVPTLDGKARVKIPAGTQSGQVFKLKGRGIPDLNGYGRGDEVIRVLVETPRKLSPRQRELLEDFARI